MQERKMFLKVLLSVCLFMVGAGGALADEVTFTAGVDTGTNSVTKDGVTVSMSNMSGDSYYVCEQFTSISVEVPGIITQVVLTFTDSGSNGPGKLYGGSQYSISGNTGTWTGSSFSLSLNVNSEARITSVGVTYTPTEFSFSENFDNVTFASLDNAGWTRSNLELVSQQGVNDSKAAKLATTSDAGTLTTPKLTNLPNVAVLKFSSKKYNSSASGVYISLSGSNCTLSQSSFELNNSYQEFIVIVTKTGNSPKISFTAVKNKQVYLDNVSITSGYVPVTITTAKYATFCNAMATDFSSTGITVYKVKASGGVARLTKVSDGIVPAGEGVVLYKDVTEAETIAVPMTTTTASLSDNDMVGVTERTLVTKTGTGGKYNYILQSGEGGSIVFNMAIEDGAYMPEGRAYLSTADGVASRLSVLFCDEAGIADRRAETADRHDAIDLYGRKWRRGSLPRGLYIIDGKKTIVK